MIQPPSPSLIARNVFPNQWKCAWLGWSLDATTGRDKYNFSQSTLSCITYMQLYEATKLSNLIYRLTTTDSALQLPVRVTYKVCEASGAASTLQQYLDMVKGDMIQHYVRLSRVKWIVYYLCIFLFTSVCTYHKLSIVCLPVFHFTFLPVQHTFYCKE